MPEGLYLLIPTGYLVIRTIISFQKPEWLLWDFILGIGSIIFASCMEFHIRTKTLGRIAELHHLSTTTIEIVQLLFLVCGIIMIINSSWNLRLYKKDWR